MGMKLAVYTVMLPTMTPSEAATAVAELGFDGIEWRVTSIPSSVQSEPPSYFRNNLCTLSLTLEAAAEGRALSERHSLRIPNLGTYIEVGDLSATDEAMKFAKAIGSPSIRVGTGAFQGTYANSVRRAADFLREVESLAGQHGIKALIEMHHGTIAASAAQAIRLVEAYDPARIGVLYDSGNLVFEGYIDHRSAIEMLGPYLSLVHLKNATYVRDPDQRAWRGVWAPLGDGVADLIAVIEALDASGYRGWLVVEDFSDGRSDLEKLRSDFDFVRQLIPPRRASPDASGAIGVGA